MHTVSAFAAADWVTLRRTWQTKGRDWRKYLAEILSPRNGATESIHLLQMAYDPDSDVAFAAIGQIASYCGVMFLPEGTLTNRAATHLSRTLQQPQQQFVA